MAAGGNLVMLLQFLSQLLQLGDIYVAFAPENDRLLKTAVGAKPPVQGDQALDICRVVASGQETFPCELCIGLLHGEGYPGLPVAQRDTYFLLETRIVERLAGGGVLKEFYDCVLLGF